MQAMIENKNQSFQYSVAYQPHFEVNQNCLESFRDKQDSFFSFNFEHEV